jgi:hypothetical protein
MDEMRGTSKTEGEGITCLKFRLKNLNGRVLLGPAEYHLLSDSLYHKAGMICNRS